MKRKKDHTEVIPRRRYDADFKASALQMIESGQRVSEVSRALGVGESLLHRWRSAARSKPTTDESEEIQKLRKQVRQLEQERDILKKALSIFSRTT